MPRAVLVRHGRAAAGWGSHPDPGLDDVGRAQADAMADALAPSGPLPILVSPLRRTRETALALERRWSTDAVVEPAVAELPSPALDPAEHVPWLRSFMAGSWSDAPHLHGWRDRVVETLLALERDTVVVTHFIAINAAVGRATADDRVVCFAPDNCSQTVIEVDGDRLRVVSLGAEAATVVQ